MPATTDRPCRRRSAHLVALVAALVAACGGGSDGRRGPPGADGIAPTSKELTPADPTPVLDATLVSVTGQGGARVRFLPGDRPEVVFRLRHADGSPWSLSELDVAEAAFSGPTFRYQRVIALQQDVAERAVRRKDGSWSYRFPPIPKTFLPPYNDSPAFDETIGEFAGLPLLDGTYTLGLFFAWDYRVDGVTYRTSGSATIDVLLGETPGPHAPRRITSGANCNQCHVDLTGHGGTYRGLASCLLCHTAGAEDLDDPALAGGTPGVSIDMPILFHRIHSGPHLPSVAGIAVVDDLGVPDHTVPPVPFLVAGSDGLRDFSDTGFPVFPTRTINMPTDPTFDALTPDGQARELATLTGIVSCFVCHGDPDGAGPVEAPADGLVIRTQQSRRVCGACHDDIDFDKGYQQFFGLMPAQPDNSQCNFCHVAEFGDAMSVQGAHMHPLQNPQYNRGLVVTIVDVAEAGLHDGDGTFDEGEKVGVSFTVRDGGGAPVDPATLDAIPVVLSGPSENPQLLLSAELPASELQVVGSVGGLPVHATKLPVYRLTEGVGFSTPALDVFQTQAAPLRRGAADRPLVVRTVTGGTGVSTLLADAAPAGSNLLDLQDASGFAAGDVVVVDAGGPGSAEFVSVLSVEGTRLWLDPRGVEGLRHDHTAGALVDVVSVVTRTEGVDFVVTDATGEIRELVEFGVGLPVLVDYATDYRVPAAYPTPLNGSPDLDDSTGEWSGLRVVDGTYRLDVWARYDFSVITFGLTGTYWIVAESSTRELLFGGADTVEAGEVVSTSSCNLCHQDLSWHHGTVRGSVACLACHGTAGAEDLPRAVQPDAAATPGTRVDFRHLVHRIHRGEDLDDPLAAVSAAGPDGEAVSIDWSGVAFPAMPGRTRHCTKCHAGDVSTWTVPRPRLHPDGQATTTRAWRDVCSACHDAPATAVHIDVSTAPSGAESCAVCHGPGELLSVENVHRPR